MKIQRPKLFSCFTFWKYCWKLSLTLEDRDSAKDNLTYLYIHTVGDLHTTQPTKVCFFPFTAYENNSWLMEAVLNSPSGSGTFDKHFITHPPFVRGINQKRKPTNSVWVAHASTQANNGDLNSARDKPLYHPHNPKAVSSQDSEWWQLLKKINVIVKLTGQPTELTE